MARVTDVFKEPDGYIQTAKLLVGENKLKNNSSWTLVHPIQKLVLLVISNNIKFPNGENNCVCGKGVWSSLGVLIRATAHVLK